MVYIYVGYLGCEMTKRCGRSLAFRNFVHKQRVLVAQWRGCRRVQILDKAGGSAIDSGTCSQCRPARSPKEPAHRNKGAARRQS